MKWKGTFNVLLLVLVALVATTAAIAVPVTIEQVKIDGDEIDPSVTNSIRVIDRGQELDVRMTIKAEADVEDAQIEAVMRGYDHDDLIGDITDVFDMRANRTYVKTLTLSLPDRMDKDLYKLRVRIDNRAGDTTQQTYDLEISSERHRLDIVDVLFSPDNQVKSGRALLTTARVRNLGSVDQDDGVKVAASIPALGISAADYIDEVEEGESTSSEELYLRIPQCAEPGVYDVVVSVEYDDGDEIERMTKKITVVQDELCNVQSDDTPKTIITAGPSSQDVVLDGNGAVYQLTLSNAGTTSKTYVITAEGYQDWADVKVSPANVVVLQPGEAKAVFMFVSAREAATAGERMFSVNVQSGGELLKEFTLTANLVEGEEDRNGGLDIRNLLLVGLLVLVVLLVILGLIIGFGKLRGGDKRYEDEERESGETYY